MSKVYVFTDYGGPETQQLVDRPVPAPPGAGNWPSKCGPPV